MIFSKRRSAFAAPSGREQALGLIGIHRGPSLASRESLAPPFRRIPGVCAGTSFIQRKPRCTFHRGYVQQRAPSADLLYNKPESLQKYGKYDIMHPGPIDFKRLSAGSEPRDALSSKSPGVCTAYAERDADTGNDGP